MSYRVLMWVIAAAVLVAIVTVIDLAKEREDGPVFIASNGPITEDQVRQKMITDGWTNVLISREARYFQVWDRKTSRLLTSSSTRGPVVYGVTMMTEIDRRRH